MTGSTVGVREAQRHLSRLLDQVEHGEEVSITRRGRVVAQLVPPRTGVERRLGLDVGRFEVPDDVDAPLPDELLTDSYR